MIFSKTVPKYYVFISIQNNNYLFFVLFNIEQRKNLYFYSITHKKQENVQLSFTKSMAFGFDNACLSNFKVQSKK